MIIQSYSYLSPGKKAHKTARWARIMTKWLITYSQRRSAKLVGEMKIISFITDQQVIRQILKHLGLSGRPTPSRDPPNTESSPKTHALVYEPFDDLIAFNIQADDWPGYDESCIAQRQ